MSFSRFSTAKLTPLILLITLIVSFLSWYFGEQTAFPVLFVVPVLLTLFEPKPSLTTLVATVVSLISGILFLTGKTEGPQLTNFLISIAGIWIAVFFILRYKTATISEEKNRERLNALFQYATEGMIISNSSGQIVMINPKAEEQFGYQKGEITGKGIEILIPQRFSERHVKHREQYTESPYPRPMGKGMMLFARKKDGSEFPVEISLSNFTTEEGKFTISFIIDISDRRKSEELLQKEKEVAQMYLDIAPVIFLVIERDGRVSLINQNGSRVLGYDENVILGSNWFEKYVSHDQRQLSKEHFNGLMHGKVSSVNIFENEIIAAGGETRLVAWKYTIIRDEKGQPKAVLGAGEDISARKKQEVLIAKANLELTQYSDQITRLNSDLEQRVHARTEELGQLISKLEHINKELAREVKERRQTELLLQKKREELRSALEKERELSELKSRFVTMASHEFRTPLSTILTSATIISKYNAPDQEEKRFRHVERIKSSVYNLTSILDDFLSLGRLEEGNIQCTLSEFDIVNFSSDLTGELKEVTRKGQTILYNHSGDRDKVVLDKNLTRNICINLLSNAIKYSDEGRQIFFKTHIEERRLTISVSDQGIGIPENEQQHIFERFFRAHNASNIQGTGLGLNIVRKYAELMHGEVSFTSEPGKGSVFKVTLPVRLDL